MRTVLIGALALCCAAPLLAGPPVQVVEGVGAPVTLDEPQAKLDSDAATVVSFTIRNDTSERVVGYRVRVYRSTNGKVLGFRTVVRHSAIEPGESRREEVKLTKWLLNPQDSLVVGLMAVTTPRGSWKANPQKAPGVPRSLEGEWSRLTKPAEQAKVIPAVLEEEPPCTPPCETGFCSNERAECNLTCGYNCTYSFRCTRRCIECESDCVCKTTWRC